MTPRIFILVALMFKSCYACLTISPPGASTPSPPDTATNDTGEDTDEPEDTGDTGGEIPEPFCQQNEVEPNNSEGAAQLIVPESWMCGEIGEDNDNDYFEFSYNDSGWVGIDVVAAEIGSFADLSLSFYDEDNDYTAFSQMQMGSTDPMFLAPVPEGLDWYIKLNDQEGAWGEHNQWQMLIYAAKAPVTWDTEEIEPNNRIDAGQTVEIGQSLFGLMGGETGDATINDTSDWYYINVPAGSVGRLVVSMDGWKFGSPMDTDLHLYSPTKMASIISGVDATASKKAYVGDNRYDLDPILSYTFSETTETGVWALRVLSAGPDATPFGWYVMTVNFEADSAE
jgi:hypothetical protein